MQKKFLIVILVVGVGALIGGGIWFYKTSQSSPKTVSFESNTPTSAPKTENQTKTLTWNDQAGFTFQYPDGLLIDKHDEDTVNYSHIDLTTSDKVGGILIMASDTKYKTLAEWIKADKNLNDGSSIDTTLGGKPAKKTISSDGNSTTIGTIDSGILFTVKLTASSNSRLKVIYDQITTSFTFVQPTQKPASSGTSNQSSGTSGDITEEETIE